MKPSDSDRKFTATICVRNEAGAILVASEMAMGEMSSSATVTRKSTPTNTSIDIGSSALM